MLKQHTSMKFISFLFTITLLSCGMCKKNSETGPAQVLFGSGGGFTGAVISYSLSSDGALNKIEGEKNISLKTIDKKTAEGLLTKAKALKDYHYNTPDNMNCFIEIKSKDFNEKYVWGMNAVKIDARLKQLYDDLMALTK